MQPQEQFIVNNLSSNNDIYNQLFLNKDYNGKNTIGLINYKTNTNLYANTFFLTYNSGGLNEIELKNYNGSADIIGNYLKLTSGSSSNIFTIENNDVNGDVKNNMILRYDSFGQSYFQLANFGKLNQIKMITTNTYYYIELVNESAEIRMGKKTSGSNQLNGMEIIIYSGDLKIDGHTITFSTIGGQKYVTWS